MKHIYPENVDEPGLTRLIQEFIYKWHHPDLSACDIPHLPPFYEKITIHTSAIATFHAPSDPSSIGGMKHECIHAVKHWRTGPGHYDSLFINAAHNNTESDGGLLSSTSVHGIIGLEIA